MAYQGWGRGITPEGTARLKCPREVLKVGRGVPPTLCKETLAMDNS